MIKRTITFRERLPFAEFGVTVLKMASDISKEYASNERVITTQPIITTDDWRKAAIVAEDKRIKPIMKNDKILVPSSKSLELK